MRKLILFMHASLDGFVAGPNGEMRWITVNKEIFDFVGGLTAKADTALYGRVTYEMMQGYWPEAGSQPDASKHDREHSAWYNKVQKLVLSRTMNDEGLDNTSIISENLSENINAEKSKAGGDILIFGSPSASHSLMSEELIDQFWIFLNPVLLGEGVALFKGIKELTKLNLLESKVFSSGVVGLHYELKK